MDSITANDYIWACESREKQHCKEKLDWDIEIELRSQELYSRAQESYPGEQNGNDPGSLTLSRRMEWTERPRWKSVPFPER